MEAVMSAAGGGQVSYRPVVNLPNVITALRIVLGLAAVGLALAVPETTVQYVATSLFVLATLTDFVDGYFAKGWGLVTPFGKLFDPLADKIIVLAGCVGLSLLGRLPWWITALIIAREGIIEAWRFRLVWRGEVVSSSVQLARVKMGFQSALIALLLLPDATWQPPGMPTVERAAFLLSWLSYVTLGVTLWTGGQYLYNYWRQHRLAPT